MAGTVTEVDTGIALYDQEGNPAKHAIIKVFDYRDTTLAYQTSTDDSGKYTLASLSGTYSIWAEKDSFVAYQDSVHIAKSNRNIAQDTLKKPGSIAARVTLLEGDPQTAVVVHALGTNIFANVNDSGRFELSGLGEGTYVLQLSCFLPGYTTTYSQPIHVTRGTQMEVPAPIKMLYNGIPYVAGLQGQYDTLNGVIRLRWNASHYPNFQEYVIYRRSDLESFYPFSLHFVTQDTVFNEAVDNSEMLQTTGKYQYKVFIRDKFENQGRAYGYIEIQTCPPESVYTAMTYNVRGKAKILVGQEIALVVSARNPTRTLRKITWTEESTQKILKEKILAGNSLSVSDTLRYTPFVNGDKIISTKVMDGGGSICTDSVYVSARSAYAENIYDDDAIAGVYPISIRVHESVKSVRVSMGTIVIDTIFILNSNASCTLDTRIIFPEQKVNVIILGDGKPLDSTLVLVRNIDPLIGCWVSVKDSLIHECYYADGSIESDRGISWLLGWERHGEKVYLQRAASGPVVFTPSFADYDHCSINGVDCVRIR